MYRHFSYSNITKPNNKRKYLSKQKSPPSVLKDKIDMHKVQISTHKSSPLQTTTTTTTEISIILTEYILYTARNQSKTYENNKNN